MDINPHHQSPPAPGVRSPATVAVAPAAAPAAPPAAAAAPPGAPRAAAAAAPPGRPGAAVQVPGPWGSLAPWASLGEKLILRTGGLMRKNEVKKKRFVFFFNLGFLEVERIVRI